jgi:hypothetical protein
MKHKRKSSDIKDRWVFSGKIILMVVQIILIILRETDII